MTPTSLTPADLPAVHALNQANVPHVGALDAAALAVLLEQSTLALVARDAQGVAGFLLAMDPRTPYQSPNYRWFCTHHRDFLYVDRIAVAERCRGQGVGRALYAEVFAAAAARGLTSVTCEVNTQPPNPDSLAFHARLGFEQVGTLVHEPGTKEVAMLRASSLTAARTPPARPGSTS